MKVFNIQDKTKVEIIEHNIFDKNLDIFGMKNNTVKLNLNIHSLTVSKKIFYSSL